MLFRAGELRAGDYSSGYAAATSHAAAAAAAGQPLLFASTMPAGRQCADSTRNEQNSAVMTSENVLVRTLPVATERATKTGFAANTLTSQTDSMYGDSVKYYVLENSKQPTYGNVLD